MATTPINAVTINNSKENIQYILNNPNSDNTSGTQIGDLKQKYDRFTSGEITPPVTWADVQSIVRSGKAPIYFNIGDQFIVNKAVNNNDRKITIKSSTITEAEITDYASFNIHFSPGIDGGTASGVDLKKDECQFYYSENSGWYYISNNDSFIIENDDQLGYYGIEILGTPSAGDILFVSEHTDKIEELIFDIIGFDHEQPENSGYEHSMTLQLHDIYKIMPYDSKEATWYIDSSVYPNGLSAGTYQYMHNSTSKIFTITKSVPVGGQIKYNNTKITTYASPTNIDIIEEVTTTNGTADNSLPNITTDSVTNITNSINRSLYGSNNYIESAIRQYINSEDVGDWWVPKNNFDRPPIDNYGVDLRKMPGFLNGMEQEFLNIIGNVKKPIYLNKFIMSNNEEPITESVEKFFLLSAPEIYGKPSEDNIYDGYPYQYYADPERTLNRDYHDTGDNNRKKQLINGNVSRWWLRSSYASNSYSARSVLNTGLIRYTTVWAATANGIAPACAII